MQVPRGMQSSLSVKGHLRCHVARQEFHSCSNGRVGRCTSLPLDVVHSGRLLMAFIVCFPIS